MITTWLPSCQRKTFPFCFSFATRNKLGISWPAPQLMSVPSNGHYHQPEPPTPKPSFISRLIDYIHSESTFFRLHLSAFTLIPLLFSGIFYGCNGQFRIRYLDSLFLCYSAMTDTGLTTANLSSLTAWQQTLLFFLMAIGDTTVISWIMVLVRKHYFRTKCEYVASQRPSRPRRSRTVMLKSISSPVRAFKQYEPAPLREDAKIASRPDFTVTRPTPGATLVETDDLARHESNDGPTHGDPEYILSDNQPLSSSPHSAANLVLSPVAVEGTDFAATTSISPVLARQRRVLTFQREGVPFPHRGMTILSNFQNDPAVAGSPANNKYEGFGGFPGPLQLMDRFIKRMAPTAYRKLERKMTMPYTTTLEEKSVPWLKFDGLVVGRNSDFHTESLSDEQVEEIGGAEYRALRMLSYLVPIYFVGTQLLSYILFAPWLSAVRRYDGVFEAQLRVVQKPWFSLFQVLSAYSGCGLSLVDLSMIPFQEAYLMIFGVMFLLLVGNHAQPIALRFIIWIGSILSHESSDSHQAFSFLLDHPRRCFLYLFPSHQTWFLLIVLVGFSVAEWTAFGVLNVGLDVFKSLPIGTRVIAGLFQGIAVRASGLTIVPIASLAPALQFFYVVMMHIAVYPVAMCIRATNVYEERSLGVFEAPPEDIKEDLDKLEPRERVGRYFNWHLRRQLSIDIWWLVWGVFIVAIVERDSLMDENKEWFNLFRVIAELVSAFAGIGLSLGFPDDNYSFVGTMRPLSKLVVVVIMVRGRHRGLPVAVDRAVLLPSELVVNKPAGLKSIPEDPNEESSA